MVNQASEPQQPLTRLEVEHADGNGRMSADFELDLPGFLELLAKLRRVEGVAITKLQYDSFFETGEIELQLTDVEDPDSVLQLLEGRGAA